MKFERRAVYRKCGHHSFHVARVFWKRKYIPLVPWLRHRKLTITRPGGNEWLAMKSALTCAYYIYSHKKTSECMDDARGRVLTTVYHGESTASVPCIVQSD